MKWIDDFLNNITMYRLLLYYLIILSVVGFILSFFKVLPFDTISYVFSFAFILTVSWIVNKTFAYAFEAPLNVESVWISALILGLIVAPPKNFHDVIFLGFASMLTMASKFILAVNKKHIFNPVAIAVVLTAFGIYSSANWWIGNLGMLPAVAVGGFLIVRKIRRWDMVFGFLGGVFVVLFAVAFINGSYLPFLIRRIVVESPLIFFATVMLTEPLTSPPTKMLRIVYGGLIGLMFMPQVHIGSLYTTPELALIIGNIFSYIVSPKYKLILKLKEKIKLSNDTYDFLFTPDDPINFTAGQYMEFTFDHANPDARGNRRYLSLANSPTEPDIRLGVKFGDPPSSFKKNLFEMTKDQKIVASQLIGDFTLPGDKNKKLVFIAGGIGITPFRSMIKYLLDTDQKRDIVMIYSAKTKDEFVYDEILKDAKEKLGAKIILNESSTQGHMEPETIAKEIPDYKQRTFYISGSHGVVMSFEDMIKKLGVSRKQIVTDYFPGFI